MVFTIDHRSHTSKLPIQPLLFYTQITNRFRLCHYYYTAWHSSHIMDISNYWYKTLAYVLAEKILPSCISSFQQYACTTVHNCGIENRVQQKTCLSVFILFCILSAHTIRCCLRREQIPSYMQHIYKWTLLGKFRCHFCREDPLGNSMALNNLSLHEFVNDNNLHLQCTQDNTDLIIVNHKYIK